MRIRKPQQAIDAAVDSLPVTVRVQCFSINYSLQHANLPVVESLIVRNDSMKNLCSVKVVLSIGGYSLPAQHLIADLPSSHSKEMAEHFQPLLIPDKLAALLERARAFLEVRVDDRLQRRQQIWVLAYNECSWRPGHERALAAFINPNNPAVGVIAKSAAALLRRLTGAGSFAIVRESGLPDAVDNIAQAIYNSLKDQYDLAYDYEPPCWESLSQRVRFPDEVIVEGKGTCWDLVALIISVLEHALYGSPAQPVIVIIRPRLQQQMHALVGCWRKKPETNEAVVDDRDSVLNWVGRNSLLLMDATGFAHGNPFWGAKADFPESVRMARELLAAAADLFIVNLAAARPEAETGRLGVTPLPFRREPPYSERALWALGLARRAWQQSRTRAIQGAHLLLGLLDVDGGAASEFFDRFSRDIANPLLQPGALRAYIMQGLRKAQQSPASTPEETGSYAAAKSLAKEEARRSGSLVVHDHHLLLALMRNPGRSLAKVLRQRESSAEECCAYLSAMMPQQLDQPQSESFPSAPTTQ